MFLASGPSSEKPPSSSNREDIDALKAPTNPNEESCKTRQRAIPANHGASLPQFQPFLMRLWRRKRAAGGHVRLRRKWLGIGVWLAWFFTPTVALSCLTCVPTPDSTQLDRFRVTTRLTKPICPLEPLQCDRDQDVCVTITMHIGHGEYWIGSGCDRRANFPQLSCHNVRTLTRSVQIGNYVQEQRRLQRVCVCGRDLCNFSEKSTTALIILFVLFFAMR